MPHPLRSARITRLHRHDGVVRPCALPSVRFLSLVTNFRVSLRRPGGLPEADRPRPTPGGRPLARVRSCRAWTASRSLVASRLLTVNNNLPVKGPIGRYALGRSRAYHCSAKEKTW
jgi:hypothetical protein